MLSSFIPLLTFVPIFLIVYGLIFIRNFRAAKRRSPISRDLLRGPGESLRAEIDDISFDVASHIAIAPFLPLLLYSAYISLLYFGGQKPKAFLIVFNVLVGLGLTLYFAKKIYFLAKKRNELSLGYVAEVAVGQELNAMAHDGYWIFHDVPAEGFNIDHVTVGPSGVLSIETKGRAKPINDDGKAQWTVEYDGSVLHFPGWRETEPLTQAQRQAKWLQEWLTKAVGEKIDVRPVLALPGWYVKRTRGGGMLVFNGKNAPTLLGRSIEPALSDKTIKQIAHQLDQRCRTVKPTAYTPDEKKRTRQ
jgi:hypothetical protein